MYLLQTTDTLFLRWEHPQKRRYYQIYLCKDMLQDYVLTKIWGGIGANNGRITNIAFSSYAEAVTEVKKVILVRTKRGYLLVSDENSEIILEAVR